jgi:hypothetical protein
LLRQRWRLGLLLWDAPAMCPAEGLERPALPANGAAATVQRALAAAARELLPALPAAVVLPLGLLLGRVLTGAGAALLAAAA